MSRQLLKYLKLNDRRQNHRLDMIEELIVRVFTARNAAHLEHWRTKSFATHEALSDFYDSVITALDKVVEADQGMFGLVNVESIPEMKQPKSMISLLESDLAWIGKNRKEITSNIPAIDNLIQDLEYVYISTLYKLKNLS